MLSKYTSSMDPSWEMHQARDPEDGVCKLVENTTQPGTKNQSNHPYETRILHLP